jgi:hypothetical protein
MVVSFLQKIKVFWIVLFISSVQAQSCRNYFQFTQGYDGSTEGIITVQLPLMSNLNLKLILSLGAQLYSVSQVLRPTK